METGRLFGHLELKAGLLDTPEAHHAPASDGHILDTALFDFASGIEFEFEG